MNVPNPLTQAAVISPEGKAVQAALHSGHDMETAARAALAAIERDARERAAPYLAHLAHVAALTPPASLVIPPDCGGIGHSGCGVCAACNPRAFVQMVGRAPRPSLASQVRAAILEAWSGEGDTTRHMIAALVRAAPDAVLERLSRLLK